MYNILVTDDEQIVIDSLSFIINKNFEGQVNVHKALSGTEALEIVTKETIDIVFMDINMPGLNGLETVSCITKLKPGIIIIMLSAFDRFQYAQEAMNLGAFKYITKPVNRNIVIQTIRSAMDLIDTERGKNSSSQELKKKLDLVSPMIESDFIYSCIFSNDKTLDIDTYFDYFNITAPWCFCCLEIPNINSENQYTKYLKIREILSNNHKCLVSSFMMNRIAVLFPFSAEEDSTSILKQIFSILSYSISSGIRAGVSNLQNDKNQLSASYYEALSALNKTSELGGINFAEKTETIKSIAPQKIQEHKKQLLLRLQQGDSAGLRSFLELYCTDLFSSEADINKIKNSFFELIVTAHNLTKEINKDFYNSSFENAFSFLTSENDLAMLKDFVQKMLLECLNSIVSIKNQNENPIIRKVCDYVQEHLSEDISLEQMADFAGVNSFYFSKLFKEEIGVTFINYVTDLRLNEAQELLKNPELSIKEITAQVGYNDQNYFSRIFKNKFGISPSEFRK